MSREFSVTKEDGIVDGNNLLMKQLGVRAEERKFLSFYENQ